MPLGVWAILTTAMVRLGLPPATPPAPPKSRFWAAMERNGVIAIGFDSTTLTHRQRGFSSIARWLQSMAWPTRGRPTTLSASYTSARVPQVFCAQPFWNGRGGCGTFDLMLLFRMSQRLWEMLRYVSVTDRCGADVTQALTCPECPASPPGRSCIPLNHSSYGRALAPFRMPNVKRGVGCSTEQGHCQVVANTTSMSRGLHTLEAAMLALQLHTLCLMEPWLLHLNSELQFKSSMQEANALSEALVAIAFTWAEAKKKGFNVAENYLRRRERALNVSQHLRFTFGVDHLEVWGLPINVSYGPRTPVASYYSSSRGQEPSEFPRGMPAMPYWGYYVPRSWDHWARVQ